MQNPVKIKIRDLYFYYRTLAILENINIDIHANTITCITGPSGQGKSSFLTILNRLCHSMEGAMVSGQVTIDFGNGFENIFQKDYVLPELRKKVGMVFQTPNPLPMSIYKNVAFPLRLAGYKNRENIRGKVKKAFEHAFLWKEVKDRLLEDARLLSGGQQQRLCLARSLVLDPQVLLLDEPTSSLDETSVQLIEDLLVRLKNKCTIIIVSHYMDQVKRIADQQFVLCDRQLKPV
ncbi:MAG TPA: phosphate ABC transporter ATP-binding protein [Desulfobacter sp.]|uniref:phosphate ABC transporter ATP-binding protein n=1 Tax=Desulfobacter sp. UBA2225 TaxID=1961413 RepID=UPI000E7DA7C4|nr:ATP-binding cassette domain-containing protein [Desulfobacter sp. UBA2225]HAR32691.1 phosphate ABC transporter ATP-binding protein [Desulfobacter sp.]